MLITTFGSAIPTAVSSAASRGRSTVRLDILTTTNNPRAALELTGKGIDVRISGVNQSPVAGGHDRAVVTQRNELLVEGVHRIRIIEFTGGVDLGMIRIHGNPWLSGGVRSGETGVAGTVHCIGVRALSRLRAARPAIIDSDDCTLASSTLCR